ncbi:cytochrome P450 [Serratia marcescens]
MMNSAPHLECLPTKRTCPFNPPEEYRFIRQECPVVRVKTPRGDFAWLITRFHDVKQALSNRRLSSDPRSTGFPTYISGEVPPPPGFFLQLDAPDHTRLRKSVTEEFLNSHVEQLKPRMAAIIDRQLTEMLTLQPPVDFVKAFAVPASAKIICELLGTPVADHPFVQSRTDIVLDRSTPPEQAEKAAIELMSYFDRIVTEKELAPGEDLLGRLIRKARADNQPSHEEIVGLAALLLLSAYDTMALAMGLGVVTLLNNPQQRQAFLADPSLGNDLVYELVRYLTINHAGLPRAATADLEIGGQQIKAGEGVLIMLSSANRDEEVFEQPDAFNLHRREKTQLGFGHGIHKCLGMHFARAELAIAFRAIFTRIPTLSIAVPQTSLTYRDEMVLYGLKALPVTW